MPAFAAAASTVGSARRAAIAASRLCPIRLPWPAIVLSSRTRSLGQPGAGHAQLITTLAGAASTVTAQVPVVPRLVAVMVAVPGPIARTVATGPRRPPHDGATVATAGSLLDHV